MKVSDCRDCKHCKRICWSHSYQPLNYHAIGMSHAYAYCAKHEKRVLQVKNCKDKEK